MRPYFLSLAFCLFATSALAAAPPATKADWQRQAADFGQMTAAFPLCKYVGYDVDSQKIVDAEKALVAQAAGVGIAAVDADAYVAAQYHAAYAEAEATMPVSNTDHLDVEMRQAEGTFARWLPVCARYAVDGGSGMIRPGAFQKSGRPQTFLGYIQFTADTGTAEDKVTLANVYAYGLAPDPDHSVEYGSYLKAAEAGSPFGAYMAASDNYTAYGTKADFTAAVKWATIAIAEGYDDSAGDLDLVKHGVPAANLAAGQAAAQAWLAAHR